MQPLTLTYIYKYCFIFMRKDYELPLGDNGNFNLRGALEKFL